MERVFADTGYWIALLNPRDDLQNKATAVARDYRSGPDGNERDGSHRVPQQLQRLRAATAASGSKGGRFGMHPRSLSSRRQLCSLKGR